jgi:hypothetical protein
MESEAVNRKGTDNRIVEIPFKGNLIGLKQQSPPHFKYKSEICTLVVIYTDI